MDDEALDTIQGTLLEILNEYQKSTYQPLKNNAIGFFIRKAAPETIKEEASLPTKYIVKGSPGQGNWAEIPWICIFDRNISTSAEKGYYIVYLFKSDMSGVYLSLNMGWTQFKKRFKPVREAQRKIHDTAKICKGLIRSSLMDFSYEPIDLVTTHELGVGYELGHICGKHYPRTNMPEDDVLIDDLRNLIGSYRELAGHLKTKDITRLVDLYKEEEIEKEDTEDREYQRNVQKANPKKIPPGPQKKPDATQSKGSMKYKTDPGIAKSCIADASYECQVDSKHKTFTSRVTNTNYVESHHLIPMQYQDKFAYSLDVPPNIIALCPNCHSLFHHATITERDNLIKHFFSVREIELNKYGIALSVNQLIDMYNK